MLTNSLFFATSLDSYALAHEAADIRCVVVAKSSMGLRNWRTYILKQVCHEVVSVIVTDQWPVRFRDVLSDRSIRSTHQAVSHRRQPTCFYFGSNA